MPTIGKYDLDEVRKLNPPQRAMIAAELCQRRPGRVTPLQSEIAKQLDTSSNSIQRANHVRTYGTPALIDAVIDGLVPVNTAFRVAMAFDHARQDEFARKVAQGYDPASLAPSQAETRDLTRTPRARMERGRYSYIQRDSLTTIRDCLAGLGHLLANTEGLPPDMTTAEAARWASDLSRQRRHLARLINKLDELKERTG